MNAEWRQNRQNTETEKNELPMFLEKPKNRLDVAVAGLPSPLFLHRNHFLNGSNRS